MCGFVSLCHFLSVEQKPWHSGCLSNRQRWKFIRELRWNVGGYQSFHSCKLEDPENYYPVKGSRPLRRNTKTWKTDNVFTGFKNSLSFLSMFLSRCPRPYLTSEFKYSHLFTPTWNWAIEVIPDKCIHEVWSAWMGKKKIYEAALLQPSLLWWHDWWWLETLS